MAKEALFNDEGGYVKGVVTYVVMDDLVVEPMSTTSNITMRYGVVHFDLRHVTFFFSLLCFIFFCSARKLEFPFYC